MLQYSIFSNFDIQYIDKHSIERKCIPYIPKYGKSQTVSKDNVIGIWCIRSVKLIEAHTSSYGRGLHGSMVWYAGTFLIAVPSRSDLKFPLFLLPLPFFLLKSCISYLMNTPFFLHIPYISALFDFLHSITLKKLFIAKDVPKLKSTEEF